MMTPHPHISQPSNDGATAFQPLDFCGFLGQTTRTFGILVSVTARLTAGTILGDPADHNIRSDEVVTSLESAGLIVGGAGSTPAKDRSALFVFKLPDLGTDSDPFSTTSFSFQLTGFTNTPSANVDLYGLARRDSSDPQPGDYYGETTTLDPTDATLIQDNILVPSSPTGLKTTNSSANTILRDFLNEAYNSGEGIGKFVFLRLSSDAPPNGVNRYLLTSAEGAAGGPADTTPQIIYNEEITLPDSPRPFIWVRDSDRSAILDKIANHSWADSVFDGMVARVSSSISSHQSDRDAFIRELPIDWTQSPPAFRTIGPDSESQVRGPTESKLNNGLDCAVLYYLTGDEKYARCAADILHNTVQGLLAVAPSTSVGNGGWIWRNDFLKEARVTGTQLPIIYDFLHDYLLTHRVHDVGSGSMVDFSFPNTQQVFRTLYQLARDHGQKDSNWSALMATCMLNSILALDDKMERDAALRVYLLNSSSRQASLDYDYRHYNEPGDIWPESLQYASGVGNIRTSHMVLLERYDPQLGLFDSYPNLPLSLPGVSYLRYPNGEQISFGDGHRETSGQPYFDYEMVYSHALANGRTELTDLYGPLINGGVASGEHDRSALDGYSSLGRHNEPLQLLWFAPAITEAPAPLALPRTDTLPFAGIALQRNVSSTGDPGHGLMAFVGGAGFVHSHASGMSMELYGIGQVLGAKSGRTSYGDTINENYYRVFASNNTVIVNGASRGDGGWKNLSINTVQTEAMEPLLNTPAVSPDISFTCSSFNDNRGSRAEARQQRTLSIIRTSPTTGYYVDIFRSDSSLSNEFHDYIYRNVGNSLDLEVNGSPLAMTADSSRFQSDIGDSNKQPGWRYFEDVETGSSMDSVHARFTASSLPAGPTTMDLHIPGGPGREYTRVTSPPIVDAPGTYDNDRAPTLVIRQDGEAWNRPFAVVYEPSLSEGTVQSVEELTAGSAVVGLVIESLVDGQTITQYVLSNPERNDTYNHPSLDLSFTGRFAVVTDRGDSDLSYYLGDGSNLAYAGIQITSQSGGNTQGEVRFTPGNPPAVTSNSPLLITLPVGCWTGNGANGSWSDAGNWGGSLPAFGETFEACFDGDSVGLSTYMDDTRTINALTYDSTLTSPVLIRLSNTANNVSAAAARNLTFAGANPAILIEPGSDQEHIIGIAAGNVEIDQTLTIDHQGSANFLVNRAITGAGGLIKTGSGTLTLSPKDNGAGPNTNTFSGTTTVNRGTLAFDKSLAGDLIINGGTLAPDGIASTSGSLTVGSAATLRFKPTDQLVIDGSVILDGALDIIADPGLSNGSELTVLNKSSTGPINGAFAGHSEGSTFILSGYSWRITYLGGDGNDVVLTVLPPADISGTLMGDASDTSIKEDGTLTSQTSSTTLLGSGGSNPWVDRSTIYVFQLPSLGSIENPFYQASFTFNQEAQQNAVKNNDLYAIGLRDQATVLGGDYYGQTATPDPTDATLREKNIITSDTPNGPITIDIREFLNAAYDSGSGAGKYLLLRLNTSEPKTGINRATLTMSEGGLENRPRIDFLAVSAPTPDEAWRQLHFGEDWDNPSISGDLIDYDRDGLVNLLERALNGDPTRSEPTPLYGVDLVEDRLTFSFNRVLSNTDLTLTVQANDDLTGIWTDLAGSINGAPFTALIGGVQVSESGSGPIRRIEIGDLHFRSDPAHPQRFMRIEVLPTSQ